MPKNNLVEEAREFADKWAGVPDNWSSLKPDQYRMLASFATSAVQAERTRIADELQKVIDGPGLGSVVDRKYQVFIYELRGETEDAN